VAVKQSANRRGRKRSHLSPASTSIESADLPELSPIAKRSVEIQWKDLIEANGFTGAHLSWHEAERERRARVYAQSLRKGDPEDVDDVGRNGTFSIGYSRFNQHAGAYWALWIEGSEADSDEYSGWLQAIRSLVLVELRQLWAAGSEWHRDWFERCCRRQMHDGLDRLLGEWASKGRQWELQKLQIRALHPRPDPALDRPQTGSANTVARPKTPSRRLGKTNPKYAQIDECLREVAKAAPQSHDEVFAFLDQRCRRLPNAEPFKSARGWSAGFQKDRVGAQVWLSKRWALLDLPPFPRGPK
jgi:hypothetical protein